jgi:hypothetical protein
VRSNFFERARETVGLLFDFNKPRTSPVNGRPGAFREAKVRTICQAWFVGQIEPGYFEVRVLFSGLTVSKAPVSTTGSFILSIKLALEVP